MLAASEARLCAVPWQSLAGLGPALDGPLGEVLSGAPAERVLDRLLRRLGSLDAPAREAVAEAVFGVGLWRRRLRAQLGVADASPRQLLASLVRDLGGRRDAAGIVALDPAALPPPRPSLVDLADRFSLPDWLAAELVRAVGEEAPALADALDQPGPLCLRPNPLRITREELARRLAAEGVSTSPGRLAPSCLIAAGRVNVYGLATHRQGLFEVQDEGSQLLGMLVEAAPGESILDACAGAGGKALLLAAAVGFSGRVHAADPDAERLGRLRARAERAGAGGIVAVVGATPPPGLGERRGSRMRLPQPASGPPTRSAASPRVRISSERGDRGGRPLGPPGMMDRALVDAPCSELGALRRGPDLRWRMDPSGFDALPGLQAEILEATAARVRPGGRLVYATCTFRAEENEGVALRFEEEHRGFHRIQPQPARDALGADGFVRTWPHRHGTDGFFAAAWERAG